MTVHTESIVFPANGGSGQGYLAVPGGSGPHRAVVVIQEWWGLNDHIKDVTRRFADGRVERRFLETEIDFQEFLRGTLRLNISVEDIRAAIAVMKERATQGPPHPFFA